MKIKTYQNLNGNTSFSSWSNLVIKTFTISYLNDENDFIEIMVHEMIHYYIAWNGIKDNGSHGNVFLKMANEMKNKYGLNITKTKDASSFKKTKNAPKSFWKSLFG